jgi:hypothetical protein
MSLEIILHIVMHCLICLDLHAVRTIYLQSALATAVAQSGMDQATEDGNERRKTTQNSAAGCLKIIDKFPQVARL